MVKGVRFEVPRGKVTALVGESGSGKSTIVMALLGLLLGEPLVKGEAQFEGVKLLGGRGPGQVRGRRMGFVTQAAMNALNPAYTIHRQITEAAELTMPTDKAGRRAHELLELVGLPREAQGAYPHELSAGMRQRVVIAMALANQPDLLIADEPTTGLDLVTQASLAASPRPSRRSDSPRRASSSAGSRTSSQAGNASGSYWPGRWSAVLASSSPMNRRRWSTPPSEAAS